MMKKIWILFLFIIFCSFSQINNDTIPKKNLKVGLALSGGGAKGFAHVGILQVLEKAGVRVDYIAGTSMGAIVGSLYASGYTANEIDSIVQHYSVEEIIKDETLRKAKPFYEKNQGEKYAVQLPIENGKIGLPKGILSGQIILNIITELTQHVDTVTDFSKLPIPFLCVATNLANGDKVVLKEGFLPEAVCASSCFPTILEPVNIDGKMLVDGGIIDNFPVYEAKKMGADIVIGVDVQNGLQNADELDSAVDILTQIIGFQIHQDDQEKKNSVELYLHPDVLDYSIASFDKSLELIEKGRQAAMDHWDELKNIASQQVPYTKDHSLDIKKLDEFYLNNVYVEGNKHYSKIYILGQLGVKEKSKIKYEDFIQGINNLSATENFKNIKFMFERDSNNHLNAYISLRENKINSYFKIAAHYDNVYKIGLLANYTSKHIFLDNDLLSLDVVAGDHLRYRLEYFISYGFYWNLGFNSRFKGFSEYMNIYDTMGSTNKLLYNYELYTNELFMQGVFHRAYVFGLGLEHQNLKIYNKKILLNNQKKKDFFDKSDYLNFIVYFRVDNYDNNYFPTQGLRASLMLRSYLYSSDYKGDFKNFSQLYGDLNYAISLWKPATLRLRFAGGITIGDNINKGLDYHLGGFQENLPTNFVTFYGYNVGQLIGKSYSLSRVDLQYQFLSSNYIVPFFNIGKTRDDLFDHPKRLFKDYMTSIGLGYSYNSFIGPMTLQYGYVFKDKINSFDLSVGFWF